MEISIKEACHENWNDMSPNEQGAFCSKCVKTVIDFTDKSLDEIKSFFAGRAQESTCGRFEDKQLSALSFDAFFEKFKRFEFTRRFAIILYFTFGMWLFGTSTATAQSDSLVKSDTTVQPEPIGPLSVGTFTNITDLPLTGPTITTGPVITTIMGTVSNIRTFENFDWSNITLGQAVCVPVQEKKAGVRPAPLKRKPVARRGD